MSGWLTYYHDGTALVHRGLPSLPLTPPTDPPAAVYSTDLPADLPATFA